MAVSPISLTHVESEVSIDRYRSAILSILNAAIVTETDREVETQMICDGEKDRYLLLGQGWHGQERVYGVWMHLEIREGRIWIQRNQTEVDLEAELLRLGIPKQAIVLGLIPPSYRALLTLEQ
jgi:XisI protein